MWCRTGEVTGLHMWGRTQIPESTLTVARPHLRRQMRRLGLVVGPLRVYMMEVKGFVTAVGGWGLGGSYSGGRRGVSDTLRSGSQAPAGSMRVDPGQLATQ
ncbi:unnamed protein product [Pleuronectes platessa]|uniref:Uncharacterized protein n=1 Tax=Pleuronectes platessa TaxID=8262 RepID=A0A9N7YUA0_PLEPL|nr:unnamed protein product [Pleuronectes platessa]